MIINSTLMPDTWDSVYNIFNSQAQATTLPSGFFPAPQRLEPLRSEVAKPAVSMGVPRLTATDAPSIAQTAAWSYQNWFGSPYEPELAIPAVSPAAAPAISPAPTGFLAELASPWTNFYEGFAKTGAETVSAINQSLPDLLMQKLGLAPKPQVVNTQGKVEYHIYQPAPTGLATIPGLKQEQPQYLFNLGLDPGIKAPVVPIAQPSAAAALGITPIMILAGLYLLFAR